MALGDQYSIDCCLIFVGWLNESSNRVADEDEDVLNVPFDGVQQVGAGGPIW